MFPDRVRLTPEHVVHVVSFFVPDGVAPESTAHVKPVSCVASQITAIQGVVAELLSVMVMLVWPLAEFRQ